MKWISNDDTIIFDPEFNEKLDIELISGYKKLIFSNYELDEKIFQRYANDNFNVITYRVGKFNQDVSALPPSLTHLTFGYFFNQQCNIPPNIKYLKLNCNNIYIINSLPNSVTELELDYNFNLEMNNLPTSIKKLAIGKDSYYNMDLNCLPDFMEELHLNLHYKKRILNIPKNLKKIVCHRNYPYINDFAIYDIEIHK